MEKARAALVKIQIREGFFHATLFPSPVSMVHREPGGVVDSALCPSGQDGECLGSDRAAVICQPRFFQVVIVATSIACQCAGIDV